MRVPATTVLATDANSSPWHFWTYFMDHRSDDLRYLWDHVYLSLLPVVVGLIISLPLGFIARRYRWSYPPIISITGLLYTIPSIALFVIVPPLFGLKSLDPKQVPIALTIYSVALLVRVVADGLASVSEETLLAASAMGFGRMRRLLSVELPIAAPVIAAGLRVATVSNVSLVAVAGTIGMDNLGRLFDEGIQLSTPTPYYPPIVLGIVLCVLLALAFDGIIVLGTRLLTPWRRVAR
ncbi:MAG TPA: ABC transporter permease [Jatrophihabitans sp.]|jgi:osmoprotectant transport system permease protein|nr:ABC transporter permease [Jatrophihabitans sp.]